MPIRLRHYDQRSGFGVDADFRSQAPKVVSRFEKANRQYAKDLQTIGGIANDSHFSFSGGSTEIHQDQIVRYGGQPGTRDLVLLNSALAMPAATFGDVYLHTSLFEMAAAYLFHLVQNHPFNDGNKRTGAVTAIIFLAPVVTWSMRLQALSTTL